MSLDTGAGLRLAEEAPDVDPWTGAARPSRVSVPAPPTVLAPTGPVAPRPRVTAVLVSHDAEGRLARTLGAVAAQTRAPDLLVAVDTGSQDRSAAMLATATPYVLGLGRRATFGDAVLAALAALSARATAAADPHAGSAAAAPLRREGEHHGQRGTEWLWLLHDDAAPAPGALEKLLAAVETAPSVAVAGCKQVDWDDDQRLLDVGFTVSPLGARVTGLDPREVDQGQHDARSDVLAVSTAGMLVRRDVWEAVGGTDPLLAQARDDVDLCRRVRLAGHRVIVVPAAVVAHRGAAGEPYLRHPWYRADRRDALHLRLAGARTATLPLVLAWTAVAAPVRAAWRLLLKQPGPALGELDAAAVVLLRPRRWLRSRSRQRRQRCVPRSTLRPLLASRRAVVRRHRDVLTTWAAGTATAASPPAGGLVPDREAQPIPDVGVDGTGTAGTAGTGTAGTGTAGTEGTQTEGHRAGNSGAGNSGAGNHQVETAGAGERAVPVVPALTGNPPTGVEPLRRGPHGLGTLTLAVLVAVGVAVAALRDVLTASGTPVSPWLRPAPGDAAELWSLAGASWRPVGLGRAGNADPFTTLLAGLGSLSGSPRTAVLALVVAAVPLSALTAWPAVAALTRSRAVRLWSAAVWAGAPALLAAVAAGRPASVVAHVLLPLTALALGRAAVRRSLPAASAAGLLLTAVLASAPSLAVPAVVVLVVLAAVAGRRAAVLVPAAVVPAVLLLPWWLDVARAPRLLLADPGVPAAPGVAPGAPWWHLLLQPGTPGGLLDGLGPVSAVTGLPAGTLAPVVAAVLAGPVLAAAVIGLSRRHWAVAAVGCLAGLAGLGVALLAERVEVAGTPTGAATGWAGPGLSLLTLGVLVAAVIGVDGATGPLRRTLPSVARRVTPSVVGMAVLVALAGPLVFAVGWALDRPDGGAGLQRTGPVVLPAIAAEEASGPAALRTLVLDVRDEGVRWTLLDTPGPWTGADSAALAERRIGADPTAPGSDAALVVPAVAALLSDAGRDVRPALADLGVGSVLARGPVDDNTVLALDAAPGLTRVATSSRRDLLWRVQLDGADGAPSRPSRARLVDADGVTLAVVPVSGAGVTADLPPGPPGRLLVLAERADAGHHATLGGRSLAATTFGGWAQAFVLPTGGGHLVVSYRAGPVGRSGPLRLGVLLLAVLLAVPLPRLRHRVAVAPARPSRPVPRGILTPPTPVAPMPQVFDAEHPESGAESCDDKAWPLTEVPRRRRFRRRASTRPEPADQPAGEGETGPDEAVEAGPDEADETGRDEAIEACPDEAGETAGDVAGERDTR